MRVGNLIGNTHIDPDSDDEDELIISQGGSLLIDGQSPIYNSNSTNNISKPINGSNNGGKSLQSCYISVEGQDEGQAQYSGSQSIGQTYESNRWIQKGQEQQMGAGQYYENNLQFQTKTDPYLDDNFTNSTDDLMRTGEVTLENPAMPNDFGGQPSFDYEQVLRNQINRGNAQSQYQPYSNGGG